MSAGIDMSAAASKVAQSLGVQTNGTRLLGASNAKAAANSTAATASAGGDITSNDFLSLLVTEMKNQDPTQPTDPNAYIQQLVGVNSLQQLIAINQDLSSVTGTASSGSNAAGPNVV